MVVSRDQSMQRCSSSTIHSGDRHPGGSNTQSATTQWSVRVRRCAMTASAACEGKRDRQAGGRAGTVGATERASSVGHAAGLRRAWRPPHRTSAQPDSQGLNALHPITQPRNIRSPGPQLGGEHCTSQSWRCEQPQRWRKRIPRGYENKHTSQRVAESQRSGEWKVRRPCRGF